MVVLGFVVVVLLVWRGFKMEEEPVAVVGLSMLRRPKPELWGGGKGARQGLAGYVPMRSDSFVVVMEEEVVVVVG